MSKNNLAYLRIAVLWNDSLTSEKLIDSSKAAHVGANTKNDLMVPDLGGLGDRYELFSPAPGGFYVNLAGLDDSLSGRLRLSGQEMTLAEARKSQGGQLTVGGSDWGVLDFGDFAIFFQGSKAPETLKTGGFWSTMNRSMLGAILFAVVMHLGFLIAAFLFWSDDPVFAELDLSDRFMKVIVEEPPEIEEEEEEESIDEDVGKKAGGEEGKFGEEDKIEKSKVPKRDGELVDKVKDVGIHKALGSDLLGRGPLQNMFGDKTGFDSKLNAAMAGAGDNLVVGAGAGGMGLRGTGGGGGGQGFGRIHGMGRIDTGGGRGTRARLGGKKRRKKKARVRRGKGNIMGFCKEKDILRVVGGRQRGIQYCYEKELARNPELNGKVTMGWRISLDGKVAKVVVQNSTLGNKSVEGCMKRQIQRWRFPKPEGGMCQIRFPFVFNAGL